MSAPPLGIRASIHAIPETKIAEVANYGRGREGLITLWFGEGDEPTPDLIKEATIASLRRGETFYTWQRGIPELRDALAEYLTALAGRPVAADRITLTNSGMTAIMIALQMICDPGDEVVIVGPVWPNIRSAVAVQGGVVREASLHLSEEGWTLDLDRLFAAVTPRTRAIFVNSPGNPTGWVMDRAQQRALLDFARRRGLWLIADEVYQRLVYDQDSAPSVLEIAEPDDRVLVVNSFSKSWMMTGWRLGWLTHPPALGDTAAKLVQVSTSGLPVFLQRGAVAAVRDGEPIVKALVERCRESRDILFERLGRWPRVTAVPPKGAFYAFVRVAGVDDSVALAKRLIDEAKVAVSPGIAFGEAGEGCLRICFACKPETIRAALDRLEPVLGGPRDNRDLAAAE
ncbi:MAG: pyridoxal phosphate-dependent aminotransferase [Thalassobaculales bacterium]